MQRDLPYDFRVLPLLVLLATAGCRAVEVQVELESAQAP